MLNKNLIRTEFVSSLQSFKIFDDKILFFFKNNQLSFDKNNQDFFLEFKERIDFYFNKDYLFISNNNYGNDNYCYDIQKKNTVIDFNDFKVNFLNLVGVSMTNKFSIYHLDKTHSIFDCKENKIIYTVDYQPSGLNFLGENHCILVSGELDIIYIHNYSKETCRIDISKYGRAKRLLGIINNHLWITTTNYDAKSYITTIRLLAIDINIGTVAIEYDNSKQRLSDGTELLQKKKQIISFSEDYQTQKTYYTVINAETGTEVESVEITTLFNRGYKNAWGFTIYNNKVYFLTRELHTITCSAFGIFNLDTKELEFLEKVPLKKGHLNYPPQTDGNKVYILDSAGTLHIYEPGDLKTSIDFDEKEIEPKVEEVKISIQEAYNNCVGKVDRIDTSQIDYFKNSTSAFYYIETDYNFKESVLITLASISTLLGDSYKLSVRDYIHDNDKSFVNVNINGTALQLELPVNHEFNDFILEPINSYLLQQGELRKIKMVEPLPAEEGIIISFLEDEEFKNCVANGFGYGINQEF